MKTLCKAMAHQAMLVAMFSQVRRHKPTNRDDFDERDARLCVRRIGKTIVEYADGDFGIFAGRQNNRWIVVLKSIMDFPGNDPMGVETFDSLSALKEKWELD